MFIATNLNWFAWSGRPGTSSAGSFRIACFKQGLELMGRASASLFRDLALFLLYLVASVGSRLLEH